MSRTPDPAIKSELLEKCLAQAVKHGTLQLSINEFGERIGSSGRMLAYHFGSKAELDRRIVALLEQRVRALVAAFADDHPADPEFLPRLWSFLTTDRKLRPLLRLLLEASVRSAQDPALHGAMDREMGIWLDTIKDRLGHYPERVLFGFHVLQGALLDFLITGNAKRGKSSIEFLARQLMG